MGYAIIRYRDGRELRLGDIPHELPEAFKGCGPVELAEAARAGAKLPALPDPWSDPEVIPANEQGEPSW